MRETENAKCRRLTWWYPAYTLSRMGGGSEEVRSTRSGRAPEYRHLWVKVATVAGLLLGCLWFFARSGLREPSYEGKVLTAWLQNYDPALALGRGSAAWSATDDAVRRMGTNCVPILVSLLREKDSRTKVWLIALARRQHVIPVRFVPADVHNVEASRAFIVLGPSAKEAVPDLIKVFEASSSGESRTATADSLGWIGPAAQAAVPALQQAVGDSDSKVRASAAWALGEIHAYAPACVPVLIGALSDPDAWVRLSAAHALGGFGVEAGAAVPALSRLTNAPKFLGVFTVGKDQVCGEASRALRRILGPAASRSTEDTFGIDVPAAEPWPAPP